MRYDHYSRRYASKGMEEPIWKKIVSEHIVSNTGRKERVRSGNSEPAEIKSKRKSMCRYYKRIGLCLLNPHSDKPSKIISTNLTFT